jgi:predicted O-methyltransferase YrrM
VRILKPDIIVETGVGGGYASAHILEAMRLNGYGSLVSIDNRDVYNAQYHNLPKYLPCGGVVPDSLRNGNWMLLMDGAERCLKPTLETVGDIDIFIHDSLHTRENMLFEYNAAWEHLRDGGLLISHDIWRPWIEFAREKKREYLVYQHYGVIIR